MLAAVSPPPLLSVSPPLHRPRLDTLLLAAVESAPLMIALVSARHPERRILYVNRAFSEGTQYAPAECFGRPATLLDGRDTDPAMSRRVRGALARGEALTVEIAAHRKDGSRFTDRLTIEPLYDESDSLTAFLCFHEDVTHRRAGESREAERDRLGSLGLLAGQVAHELNNLLQPIVSFAALLRDDARLEAADIQEDLTCILDHARNAREIVANILKFSRKDPSPVGRISLVKALSESLALVRPLLPPGIEFLQTIDPAAGAVVINRTELTQVMTNLAVNAAQAMRGSGTLSVTLARRYLDSAVADRLQLPAGDYAVIAVADTGCGMDDETKVQIFDPFFTTKPIGTGTGLGLSVVYGIVRGWAGAISVESAPGEGACFTVFIPLAS
jgi:PAS domain S-box-containing protein